jgi:hypothetical protein
MAHQDGPRCVPGKPSGHLMNTTHFPKGTPVSWKPLFGERKFGRVVTSQPLPSGHIVVRENSRAAEIAQCNDYVMPHHLTREME